jgi:hypothetical protein
MSKLKNEAIECFAESAIGILVVLFVLAHLVIGTVLVALSDILFSMALPNATYLRPMRYALSLVLIFLTLTGLQMLGRLVRRYS